MILALAMLLASFEPSTDPAATHEAAVIKVKMGPGWCIDEQGAPWQCETIQPPQPVTSWLQGSCLYIADEDDVAPGEVLVIVIRATRDGIGSPVCTHDGGPLDCGTVELIEADAPCP